MIGLFGFLFVRPYVPYSSIEGLVVSSIYVLIIFFIGAIATLIFPSISIIGKDEKMKNKGKNKRAIGEKKMTNEEFDELVAEIQLEIDAIRVKQEAISQKVENMRVILGVKDRLAVDCLDLGEEQI